MSTAFDIGVNCGFC